MTKDTIFLKRQRHNGRCGWFLRSGKSLYSVIPEDGRPWTEGYWHDISEIIRLHVELKPSPKILIIGFGGGTIGYNVQCAKPLSLIVGIEPNQRIVALCKNILVNHFSNPALVGIRPMIPRDGSFSGLFDVVVIDAFVGTVNVGKSYLERSVECMKPDGMIILNGYGLECEPGNVSEIVELPQGDKAFIYK